MNKQEPPKKLKVNHEGPHGQHNTGNGCKFCDSITCGGGPSKNYKNNYKDMNKQEYDWKEDIKSTTFWNKLAPSEQGSLARIIEIILEAQKSRIERQLQSKLKVFDQGISDALQAIREIDN